MKAALHPHETARLGALRRYEILDTPREADYDEVVDIARRICRSPIAVINLIDKGRQWFKAEIGLDTRETPIESSICAHAILEGDFVEIADTLADRRLNDNPLCLADPGFRFYAGTVLRTGDGLPIGTLCVLDYRPRVLDDLQRDTLRLLGRQVMRQLELRAALVRADLLRREIDHRVKNSLHSVAAFTHLQRRGASDTETTLRAVEQQISSVALLHDLIAVAPDEQIDLGSFLDRLTALLAGIVPTGIAVTGSFAPLTVDPPVVTAIGTIVNELVANAVKHSFAPGGGGRIVLTGVDDGSGYRLVCHDDGRGAPIGPVAVENAPRRVGLGLKIMNASIAQLNGTFVRGPVDGGYRSIVSFPHAV